MRLRAPQVIIAACLAFGLVACSTPTSPTEIPTSTGQIDATPVEGLPTDLTLAPINGHTTAGEWAYVATTTASLIAVRINDVWQGRAGDLSNRSYTQGPDEQSIDTTMAVPYYLSWSYVVVDGTADDEPAPILLPSDGGNLFGAESPFADHDCPDYTPITTTGPGYEIRHCVVSMSQDGSLPVGFAVAVPNQTEQYWFFDAPPPVLLYSTDTDSPATPTDQPT